ncbi:MAG: zinc-ribbon domain-containing protein [Oscillospiraceae bacterium]|nr:zinc-ribbon domain-containing protein [Oscillospiraceae bacterium]
MSFPDKISANLTNAGRTVSQSLKNFTDATTMQKEISAEKRNIKTKLYEIGQLYYEMFKDDPGADFFEQVESITNSQQRIEELEAEIQEVRERKPDLVQIPSTPKVKPSAMVCMQCGSTFDTSQTFCANCGTKLTAQYPTPAAAAAAPAQTAEDVQNRAMDENEEISETFTQKPSLTKPADIILHKPEAPTDGKRFCTHCGAPAAADSSFCAMCGNKLQ